MDCTHLKTGELYLQMCIRNRSNSTLSPVVQGDIALSLYTQCNITLMSTIDVAILLLLVISSEIGIQTPCTSAVGLFFEQSQCFTILLAGNICLMYE